MKPTEIEGLRERARKWIVEHRPEAVKCEYCGAAQSFAPNAGSWANRCLKSPRGESHMYLITIGTDPEVLEANRMADFATLIQQETREECAKAVCMLCRQGCQLIKTKSGIYTHVEDACEAAAIRDLQRME